MDARHKRPRSIEPRDLRPIVSVAHTFVRPAIRGVIIAFVVAMLTAAVAAVLTPQAAAAIVKPPVFESVIAGDGNHIDAVTALAVNADGTLYSCGSVWHETTGYDITVTCYADAPLGWTKTWNSDTNEDDTAVDVAIAPDGSVFVYGSQGSGADAKPLLLRYGDGGDFRWAVTRAWGSAQQLVTNGINMFACCVEDNEDSGGTRVVVTAYLADGTTGWEAKYQTRGYKVDTYPTDVWAHAAGRVYVCGGASGTDLGQRAFIVSLAAGSRRWAHLYDGPGRRGASFAALTPSPAGDVYAVGRARSDAYDILVTRYTASGTRVLTKRLGVADGRRQWATDAAADSLGRLAVCGAWRASNKGYYVALLRRNGTVKWSHNYRGDKTYGYAKEVVVDGSDRVCVTGNAPGTRDTGGTCRRGPVATYAFSGAGVLRWRSKWPTTFAASTAFHQLETRDIAVWQSSNVWVCGSSDDRSDTGPDQFVIGWAL